MTRTGRISLAILFAMSSLTALADSEGDAIKLKLEQLNPKLKVSSVVPSPIAGLYEVFANGNIYYVDKSAQYVLAEARLVEVESKRNLTAERLKALSTIKLDSLPLNNAIEIKKGTGAYRFAVFTDPDCPYCKSLETGLEKLGISDYTAYIFLYPLESIHKDARWKAESIWCANDRTAAWNAWMKEGKLPEKKTCENPVTKVIELAQTMGINATPTIYLQNGEQTTDGQLLVDAIKQNK